jgi:hypothetical protein
MTTIKKAQTGKKVAKKPTYKNLKMGVANQSKAEGRDYTEVATKQDSINYKRGFDRGLKKDKETRNDIDEVEKQGRWEGLNTKKNGGPVKKVIKKAKNGAKFPDLNKDGKVTKADILKGRGVIAKKGATVKKAQDGTLQPMGKDSRKVGKNKYVSEDGNYKMKFKGGSDTSAPTSAVQRRTLKGFLKGAPKAAGKMALKSGGKMTKCKYGCK